MGFGQVYSPTFTIKLPLADGGSYAPSTNTQQVMTASSWSATTASITAADSAPLAVVVDKRSVKKIKTLLEQLGVYDKSRRVNVALPHFFCSAIGRDSPRRRALSPSMRVEPRCAACTH